MNNSLPRATKTDNVRTRTLDKEKSRSKIFSQVNFSYKHLINILLIGFFF